LIYLGVSLRVGLLWASLCFGAALLSALANATLRIPNALRHSNIYILIFLRQKQLFSDKIVKIKHYQIDFDLTNAKLIGLRIVYECLIAAFASGRRGQKLVSFITPNKSQKC
jgi:hypothetical protein